MHIHTTKHYNSSPTGNKTKLSCWSCHSSPCSVALQVLFPPCPIPLAHPIHPLPTSCITYSVTEYQTHASAENRHRPKGLLRKDKHRHSGTIHKTDSKNCYSSMGKHMGGRCGSYTRQHAPYGQEQKELAVRHWNQSRSRDSGILKRIQPGFGLG